MFVLHSGMRNRFVSGLTPTEASALAPYMRNVVLQPGSVLWRRGDLIDRVYFPHTGMISLGVPTDQGHSIECALIGRDGIVGGQAACNVARASTTATVRVGGTATQIDAADLSVVLSQQPSLRDRVMRFEAAQCAQAHQTAACNAAHPVEGRLCRWLLEIHDRAENSRLSLTQEFLANILGVRRTTVTFVAGTLQACGAIKWQRNYAIVLNRDILEEKACSCYADYKECADQLTNDGRSADGAGSALIHHHHTAAQPAL